MSADSGVRRARVEDDVLPVIRAAFADEGEKVGNLWAELEQSDALRASLVAEQDGADRRPRRAVPRMARCPS